MLQTTIASPIKASRVEWLDAAKGLGIVLVVFGHVWRGLESGGLFENQLLFTTVDRFVYLFHMPIFFIMSGYLFQARRQEQTTQFAIRTLERMLWPFLLWSWVYLAMKISMGSATNHPTDPNQMSVLPLPAIDHMWFLWALLLMQTIAFAFRATAKERSTQLLPFFFLLILVCYALNDAIPTNVAPYINGLIPFFPFFVAGMLFRAFDLLPRPETPVWIFLAVFAAAELIAFAVGSNWTLDLILALIAATSILFVFVAGSDAIVPRVPGLLTLGQASMAIYVVHIFFTAAARTFLTSLHVRDIWIHVLVGTLAGLVGPLAIYFAAKRWRLQRILGF